MELETMIPKEKELEIRRLIAQQEILEVFAVCSIRNVHDIILTANFFWAVEDIDNCIKYYSKALDICEITSDMVTLKKIHKNLETIRSCCKTE